MDILAPMPPDWFKVIDLYLTGPKITKRAAYEAVYGKLKTAAAASQGAHKVFSDPRTVAEIARRQSGARERNSLVVDDILQHLYDVVSADPRDLNEVRRCACRYCYGNDFRYQRKPSEYEADLKRYKNANANSDPMALDFDVQGGVGYNPTLAPRRDCPECFGYGEMITYARDMRDLTKAQAELIGGVKQTENGFEIKTRDKTKVLELAMRTMGMMREDKGDDENNIPPAGTVTWTVIDGDKDPVLDGQ